MAVHNYKIHYRRQPREQYLETCVSTLIRLALIKENRNKPYEPLNVAMVYR